MEKKTTPSFNRYRSHTDLAGIYVSRCKDKTNLTHHATLSEMKQDLAGTL